MAELAHTRRFLNRSTSIDVSSGGGGGGGGQWECVCVKRERFLLWVYVCHTLH